MKKDFEIVQGYIFGVLLVSPVLLVTATDPLKLFIWLIIVHSLVLATGLLIIKRNDI